MKRLVKIKFSVTFWTVRPSLDLYVCCDTSDSMFGLETICPLRGFQGEPRFSQLVLLFSKSTSKTIKGFLRSPRSK
jgi:hypothetical protein